MARRARLLVGSRVRSRSASKSALCSSPLDRAAANVRSRRSAFLGSTRSASRIIGLGGRRVAIRAGDNSSQIVARLAYAVFLQQGRVGGRSSRHHGRKGKQAGGEHCDRLRLALQSAFHSFNSPVREHLANMGAFNIRRLGGFVSSAKRANLGPLRLTCRNSSGRRLPLAASR